MKIIYVIQPRDHEVIREFYSTLGIELNSFDKDTNFYSVNNFLIILTKANGVIERNLYFIQDGAIIKFRGQASVDEQDWILRIQDSINHNSAIDIAKNIVPIIRTHDIERLRDDYFFLGNWIKQKHGNGPRHYCLVSESRLAIAQIYPLRKTNLKNRLS
ncbi:MAG: hypothetical protein SFT68_04850 [Rickettsiaceae bacterium]|nr:hypothetical protein [Rickettsiaceae bacterium]